MYYAARLLAFGLFLLLLGASPTKAALAVDGSCQGIATGATPLTCTLTTTQTNDWIGCAIYNELNGTTRTVTGVSDTSTLTWASRGIRFPLQWTDAGGSNTKNNLDLWWAKSTGALTTDVITITFSGNPDDASIVCWGISGDNFSAPFDINSSLPTTATNVTGVASQLTMGGVSTSSTNTMIFNIGATSAGGAISVDTGWTIINACAVNGGGTNNSTLCVSEQAFASAQTGITASWSAASTKANWGLSADALCQSGGCAVASGGDNTVLTLGIGP